MSWLLEEDHCRRRLRRRSVWSAYRWILIRVVSKIKKKAAVQPQKQQTVRQLIIQIVGFGLKNKKVVRCTAAIFTLLYLSLFGTCKLPLPLRPRPPARGLYRSAIIALQLCQKKPYQTRAARYHRILRFSFCYLLHCTLCGYLVILRRINRGERRYLFLFCAAFFLILLLLLPLLLCRSSRSFNKSFNENFKLKIHSLHLCTLYDSWAPPPARPPTF